MGLLGFPARGLALNFIVVEPPKNYMLMEPSKNIWLWKNQVWSPAMWVAGSKNSHLRDTKKINLWHSSEKSMWANCPSAPPISNLTQPKKDWKVKAFLASQHAASPVTVCLASYHVDLAVKVFSTTMWICQWKWKFCITTMWICQWKWKFCITTMWLLLLELPLLLLPLLLPQTAVEGLTLEGSSTSYAQVFKNTVQNTKKK